MSDARETHSGIPRGRAPPLLFATASFPCRGSLIIRLPAEQGTTRSRNKRREGGRERDEWKEEKKKNNESGGNFSVNRYITR